MPLIVAMKKSFMVICEFMIMRFHLFMEGDLEVMFELDVNYVTKREE